MYFKDWIKVGIMNVTDVKTPECIASFQSVNKLLEISPKQGITMLSMQLSITFVSWPANIHC